MPGASKKAKKQKKKRDTRSRMIKKAGGKKKWMGAHNKGGKKSNNYSNVNRDQQHQSQKLKKVDCGQGRGDSTRKVERNPKVV